MPGPRRFCPGRPQSTSAQTRVSSANGFGQPWPRVSPRGSPRGFPLPPARRPVSAIRLSESRISSERLTKWLVGRWWRSSRNTGGIDSPRCRPAAGSCSSQTVLWRPNRPTPVCPTSAVRRAGSPRSGLPPATRDGSSSRRRRRCRRSGRCSPGSTTAFSAWPGSPISRRRLPCCRPSRCRSRRCPTSPSPHRAARAPRRSARQPSTSTGCSGCWASPLVTRRRPATISRCSARPQACSRRGRSTRSWISWGCRACSGAPPRRRQTGCRSRPLPGCRASFSPAAASSSGRSSPWRRSTP